ncbi:hypothetical protein BDN72DRAFT_906975 [Pluteus cervinus]|uniref:Uncharacterized protein n=1 Tax=Pluteus cervinus TaxID=181527 RepID=A0ACD2ZYL1_9AGAR|nr:hypothetical protein BDN72DRAFT_906975 [Pluteus cervinus]
MDVEVYTGKYKALSDRIEKGEGRLEKKITEVEKENKRLKNVVEGCKRDAEEEKKRTSEEISSMKERLQELDDVKRDLQKLEDQFLARLAPEDSSDEGEGPGGSILLGKKAKAKKPQKSRKRKRAADDEGDKDGDSENEDEGGMSPAERRSYHAYKHSGIKELVRFGFQFKMDHPLSSPATFPEFPADDNDETWPKVQTVDDDPTLPVVRFRWNCPKDQSDNFRGIRLVVSWVRRKGAAHTPALAKILEDLSENHLQQRVTERFEQLRREYREHQRDKELEPSVKAEKAKKKTLTSRAQAKLKVRKRKRESLPDEHELRNPKYDVVFEHYGFMSCDEDDVDEAGKLQQFKTRAPVWRSEKLQEVLDGVDKVADPAKGKGKATPRIKGNVLIKSPPSIKDIRKRARRWMVSPNYLKENKQYDKSSKVIDNGKLWGEAANLAEMEAEVKEVKKGKKKARQDPGESDEDEEDEDDEM